jgi:hypothetical protein
VAETLGPAVERRKNNVKNPIIETAQQSLGHILTNPQREVRKPDAQSWQNARQQGRPDRLQQPNADRPVQLPAMLFGEITDLLGIAQHSAPDLR